MIYNIYHLLRHPLCLIYPMCEVLQANFWVIHDIPKYFYLFRLFQNLYVGHSMKGGAYVGVYAALERINPSSIFYEAVSSCDDWWA